MSEAVSNWLNLYNSSATIIEGEDLYKRIFTKCSLAAHVFNPKYKDEGFSASQKTSIRFFIAKCLKDQEEFSKFDEYFDGIGPFAEEELKNFEVQTYWMMLKGHCLKLSQLAIKFSSLPAFSCDFKQADSESRTNLISDQHLLRKLNFIKSNL